MDLQDVKADLDASNTVTLSVMTNPLDVLGREANRFAIDTRAFPIATDAGGAVGKKFGAWGKGMHSNNFGHSFVLIDKSGTVRWQVEEPSMFVSPQTILRQIAQVNSG